MAAGRGCEADNGDVAACRERADRAGLIIGANLDPMAIRRIADQGDRG